MEYEDQVEDLEYEQLKAAMGDGLGDSWINLPTRTVSKYLSVKILEELSEIDKLAKNPNSGGLQAVLNKHIVVLAESIRGF